MHGYLIEQGGDTAAHAIVANNFRLRRFAGKCENASDQEQHNYRLANPVRERDQAKLPEACNL
jgi:hypothetical protein